MQASQLPCKLLSLDLAAVVQMRAQDGTPVTYQQAFDEVREILITYCIKLKRGEVKLTGNKTFTINYNEIPVAQFGFDHGKKHRPNPPVSSSV